MQAVGDTSRTPAEPTPAPDVPGPVERTAAALFGALSAVRGRRIFHPRGDGFDAQIEVDRPLHRYDGIPLLAERSTRRGVARLSRAVGLPQRVPDLLGIGLRIGPTDGRATGPGVQDLLLVSSGRLPAARHLLLPTRGGFRENTFSSVLPYRIGNDLKLLGALPTGPLQFDLAIAGLRGDWEPFAQLRLRAALDPVTTEHLELNPWNTSPGLKPVGPLNGLRRSSYQGSQAGRQRRVAKNARSS